MIWWFALKDVSLPVYLFILLLTTILAIYSAGVAEKTLGKDAGQIVIDEVVGQFITLTLCIPVILHAVIGFFLFRLFDVWKPLYIRKAEKIRGGMGIVLDDVLAGIAGLIVLQIIILIT